jgi:hypothetical protein
MSAPLFDRSRSSYPSVVRSQEFDSQGSNRDERAPTGHGFSPNELSVVRFFPYGKWRTPSSPCVKDFRIGARFSFKTREDQVLGRQRCSLSLAIGYYVITLTFILPNVERRCYVSDDRRTVGDG